MMHSIGKLQKALGIFSTIYYELPLQQIMLFLQVAVHDGVTMPELTKLTKMPQGSVSRNIKALGTYLKIDTNDPNRKAKGGWGLLETRQDLYNRKSSAVFLTPKGKEVVREINEILA